MRSIAVKFKNRRGLDLSGRVELPANGLAQEYALFAHCFTCSKDLSAVRNISRALSAQGFGVLRFDFTGLGRSEGEFKDSHFSANIEDLEDAATFLAEHYKAPALLIGHSLGGAAAVIAASRLPAVQALVTIGAPADAGHVKHLIAADHSETTESFAVDIGGRPFEIDSNFVTHLSKYDLKESLKSMRKAILVCHTPQDKIVSIDNAAQIYQAAHHPKSFISLDGADHLLSASADSLYVGNMIASWAARYIDVAEELPTSDHQVVVSLSEPGFTSKVRTGKHNLIADEPQSIGGKDLGPAPYDFVSIGLAACTAMTIRMYGDRKGWPIDEVSVHVDHSKMDNPEGVKQDLFERSVELVGALDETQRKRIMQIADKCPVHRTLEASSRVNTVLGE